MHSQQPPDPTRPHAQAGSADADGTPSTLVRMHADKPLPYPSVTDHPSHCGQPMAAPGEEEGNRAFLGERTRGARETESVISSEAAMPEGHPTLPARHIRFAPVAPAAAPHRVRFAQLGAAAWRSR
jgi:hypothetical protein